MTDSKALRDKNQAVGSTKKEIKFETQRAITYEIKRLIVSSVDGHVNGATKDSESFSYLLGPGTYARHMSGCVQQRMLVAALFITSEDWNRLKFVQ